MKVGSLFAGIGGFDLAAERAGMTVAWQSELDAHASKVLAHHWPDVPNYGDIHGITAPPVVDVLTGGFPCQDYSVAGRGAGLAGDRGALWWQMRRVVAECRPTWVVGENVHGLTTSRHQDSLRTIIGSLVDLGYGVVWRVFDAQWFGVAQRRRRVFIVGHSGGQPRPEILALAQSVCGDSPPSRAERVLAPAGAGASALNLRGREGGARPELDDLASLRSAPGGSSRSYVAAFVENQRGEVWEVPYTNGINTAGGKPGQGYAAIRVDSHVRRLTPLECERLQGFPDGWTAIPGNSDTQRYRQLGNAVAVPVVEWILKRVGVSTPEGDER